MAVYRFIDLYGLDLESFQYIYKCVHTRDGHADIFGDAHRCGYLKYPTYVGYIAIIALHFSDRQPSCIRMAIPI